ncbi:Bardet-Biedl syndrome 5 protein homolog isoform X2 [Adelges cooleyi]|uniref:Bardet-Biedl syndrome 5 protein homolog isoform X2 n=1 Tax=Adelges cooleyi TaxID=133065 RepID=UPI002180000C|nr:Bardet-Biedl syndrome 5 protein homolog isoform X2 [Adelges cooleyi]
MLFSQPNSKISRVTTAAMNLFEEWEDQEIQFDLSINKALKMRNGEKIIDRLEFIEDTKGNGGDKGVLVITNLRAIWHSMSIARISLSIGYNCIQDISTRIVNSRLKGTTEAIYIQAKYNGLRYEFVFTNLIPGNTRHFTSFIGVYKAYNTSRLYRELKLRGAIMRNGRLKLLMLEKMYSTINGVWNLSSEQGNLGAFIITNVRLVWYAESNETFNLSLPYIHISSVKIRESKFGEVLVIETSGHSGGFMLGFRIDPKDRLKTVTKELSSLARIHIQAPEFGVHFVTADQAEHEHELRVATPTVLNCCDEFQDENDIGVSNTLASYSVSRSGKGDGPPKYDPTLGLAVETLPEGYTLSSLWEVIPTTSSGGGGGGGYE